MRDRWTFYDNKYPYFMTCTIVGWLPVFTRLELVNVVLESWKYLQKNRGALLFGYVILENHLHWIAKLRNPGQDAGDFKSFTARTIVDWLTARGEAGLLSQLAHHKEPARADRAYQVWQEGSHPIVLESEGVLRQKLEYTHNNPIKRGYVDDPTHWRYSSARNYAGMPGLIDVVTRW